LQHKIDNILEFNGRPGQAALLGILSDFEDIYPRWKTILLEEQAREDSIYGSGEGPYLRRFSPAWIYTRIVHKVTDILGRLKHYKREHSLLTKLLQQHLFHSARRGAWYQRKALIEENYMAEVESHDCVPDSQPTVATIRKWKRITLGTCESGLEDPECHIIFHYDLQKRIKRLERSLKLPKRELNPLVYSRYQKIQPSAQRLYG
jgi:Fanconi-associated nuclease 1